MVELFNHLKQVDALEIVIDGLENVRGPNPLFVNEAMRIASLHNNSNIPSLNQPKPFLTKTRIYSVT